MPGDQGDLLGMREHVLPVARAEMQPAQRPDGLGAHRVDADLEEDALALLVDGLRDLLGDLLDDLLDARGVDPPVGDQAAERRLGDLPPDGVEARDDHRLRGVVDDDVHARQRLQGADVAPLAADDPPLHLVVGQAHRGHGHLGGHVRGQPLDGRDQDVARLLVRGEPRFLLDEIDRHLGVVTRLVLEALHEKLLRFRPAETGNPFQFRGYPLAFLLQRRFGLRGCPLPVADRSLLLLKRFNALF